MKDGAGGDGLVDVEKKEALLESSSVNGGDNSLVDIDGDLGEALLGISTGSSEIAVGLVKTLDGRDLVEVLDGDGLDGRDVADGARVDAEDTRADKVLLDVGSTGDEDGSGGELTDDGDVVGLDAKATGGRGDVHGIDVGVLEENIVRRGKGQLELLSNNLSITTRGRDSKCSSGGDGQKRSKHLLSLSLSLLLFCSLVAGVVVEFCL